MNQIIDIYTDGACSSTNNIGGWATLICGPVVNENSITDAPHYRSLTENYTVWFGGEENSTNNRMELRAMLCALQYADKNPKFVFDIYADSAYVVNCFKDKWYERWERNGWRTTKKTPVENRDLWEQIVETYKKVQNRVVIRHVKGHSNFTYNNVVDAYAVAARKQFAKLIEQEKEK